MLKYAVNLVPDDGTFLVDFVDFPEAHSVGDTVEEALREAVDGLHTAIDMYMEDRRRIPEPSTPADGQHTVALSTLESAKVLLWNEMLQQRLRKADLARLLNVHQPQVDRLFNLDYSCKFDLVEKAADALGRRLTVELQ